MTDWGSFPSCVLQSGEDLYRIHRREHTPERLSRSGHQRFDSPSAQRARSYGVCYLGTTPVAAYLEVFGRMRALPVPELTDRCLSVAPVVRAVRLADLTNRTVLGRFGVTASHSTAPDYAESQCLSARLHSAGFDGIRYRVRHDPAMELEAVALFAPPALGDTDNAAVSWSDPLEIPA